jgi:hypothetical protein
MMKYVRVKNLTGNEILSSDSKEKLQYQDLLIAIQVFTLQDDKVGY